MRIPPSFSTYEVRTLPQPDRQQGVGGSGHPSDLGVLGGVEESVAAAVEHAGEGQLLCGESAVAVAVVLREPLWEGRQRLVEVVDRERGEDGNVLAGDRRDDRAGYGLERQAGDPPQAFRGAAVVAGELAVAGENDLAALASLVDDR